MNGINKMQNGQQQQLGQGGYGRVQTFVDPMTNKKMARKYFHKPPSDFSSYRQTARTIRQIDPNAQNFTGIMLNKQQQVSPQYMLMEYGGKSLQKLNGKEQFEALFFHFPQLMEAVLKLERKGFIHGDIKLENVVYSPDKGLRLIDFDLMGTVQQYQQAQRQGKNSKQKFPKHQIYFVWPPELFDDLESYFDNKFVERDLDKEFISNLRRYYHANRKPRVNVRKIDVWSVGLMAMSCFKSLFSYYLNKNEKTMIRQIITNNLLNPDPSQRNLQEARSQWEQVVQNYKNRTDRQMRQTNKNIQQLTQSTFYADELNDYFNFIMKRGINNLNYSQLKKDVMIKLRIGLPKFYEVINMVNKHKSHPIHQNPVWSFFIQRFKLSQKNVPLRKKATAFINLIKQKVSNTST